MPATFRHQLPVGAECLAGGGTAFPLWAPAQSRVHLAIGQNALPMERSGDGVFTTAIKSAQPGARYQFVLDGGERVPDPMSRFQPGDVDGPSEVIDPAAYAWQHGNWKGRPWTEAVVYELHVGCFSPAGTFDGVRRNLDHLVALGVTAIELMPVSDFQGTRNWGYDGVLPFAPDSSYGRPEDLKLLIDEAHGRGLMMILDVVYNHFGPSGNYLGLYAPGFFTDRYHTPWGAAVNFEGERHVRDYFIHNALYWLNEYRFDGLRFDAVHAIYDAREISILQQLGEVVRTAIEPDRHVHLILENDRNESRFLRTDAKGRYDAQWNDDYHHAAHVVATGESHGYYADYAVMPMEALAATLARGFLYDGKASSFRGGAPRGESSAGLPYTAFINFLQNHDQIGNRGDAARLPALTVAPALRALTAITLLSPHIPMLFMGEEWASATPFHYFCDYAGDLARAVQEGRKKEFPGAAFTDPISSATFEDSKLRWDDLSDTHHAAHLAFVRDLIALRRQHIVPLLSTLTVGHAQYQVADGRGLWVQWSSGANTLTLAANLSGDCLSGLQWTLSGTDLHASADVSPIRVVEELPPWSVCVRLDKSP